MSYTPEHWEAHSTVVRTLTGRFICKADMMSVPSDAGNLHEINEANAKLLAAAPELLEACEAIDVWLKFLMAIPASDFGRKSVDECKQLEMTAEMLLRRVLSKVHGLEDQTLGGIP